ncbi:MAG: HAMP domain-containing histidine kinase [Clostridia bacterium]|nr:HAMP domain-containing histidine kinase [Clostridia bacterium]
MRFLRNPEVKYPLFFSLAVSAAAIITLSHLSRRSALSGGAVIGICAAALFLCIGSFLAADQILSKKVRSFTVKAERSLRGNRSIQFDDFREGDFSVLSHVVSNMAMSHARQEEQLKEEKGFLSVWLANITHQIKTPLTSITLSAESLAENEISPQSRKRAAHRILDSTEKITDFISTLLRISRLDADAVTLRTDPLPVPTLIEKACEPLEMYMELREIVLKKNVPDDAVITGDPTWMTQAISNIIKNCAEHSPPGGSVYIDVDDNPLRTRISIRDEGPGIDPEDLPRIFERFYRGKNPDGSGAGIGLSFSSDVIRKTGGTVKAENHPDGGAMFTVTMYKVNV